jgi:hypothetical protein
MKNSNIETTFSPEKTKFTAFHILRGHVESAFEFDTNKVKGCEFNIEFSTEINLEQTGLKSNLSVFIKTESAGQNKNESTAEFVFAFIFDIENLESQITTTNDGNFEIDFLLSNAIASISYSTARGILMTRLQGTALRNFILPVIDPNQLLKLEPHKKPSNSFSKKTRLLK